MKGPVYKAGQQVVMPGSFGFPTYPQVESNRLYTIAHHVWNGKEWYLTLKEFGALVALNESAFRAATKREINTPFLT